MLLIENPSVASIHAFTMLGMSTSRGDKTKIGQFGSGNKHGLLSLLRADIEPIIFLGTKKLTFQTNVIIEGSKQFSQIVYTLDSTAPVPLSFCLEFGELDWTDIHMALREFISNAIDASPTLDDVKIEFTGDICGKEGYTRIFLPSTQQIREYVEELPKYFLHFKGKQDEQIIPKQSMTNVRVYRKGVFVREINIKSNFDYNLSNDVKIDESRNLDDFYARFHSQKILLSKGQPDRVINIWMTQKDSFESDLFSSLQLDNSRKPEFLEAWLRQYGNKAVLGNALNPNVNTLAAAKGYTVHTPLCDHARMLLMSCGVCTAESVCDEVMGDIVAIETPITATRMFNETWTRLSHAVGGNIPRPQLTVFRQIMNGGSMKLGMYDNNVVYINEEAISSRATYIEEMCHHITKADDFTRDFQDFLVKMVAVFMEKVC